VNSVGIISIDSFFSKTEAALLGRTVADSAEPEDQFASVKGTIWTGLVLNTRRWISNGSDVPGCIEFSSGP